jgi:hypothetical protein
MKRATGRSFARRGRANAVNAVILNRSGRDLREAHLAEERDQVEPQANAVTLHPFGAALAFRDNGIFLLELLGCLGKGLFGFYQACGQLAAKAEIPAFRERLGLLQPGFLGTGTVLAAFYGRRTMPDEPTTPVNIDLPSKDFMARHTGPLLCFCLRYGNRESREQGCVK